MPRPGGVLSYRDSGAGVPITLLHGFTQTSAAWSEFEAAIGRQRRFIAPDLRGHGDSRYVRGTPHTMAACVEDLVALWDQLGVATTDLLGYSMGGRLALQAAVTAPQYVRSLVVVSAHAGLEPAAAAQRRIADEELASSIEAGGVESFLRRWLEMPLFAGLARRGSTYIEEQRTARLVSTPGGLAASLRGMGAGAMRPIWDDLVSIKIPTLFIAGAEDARYVEFAHRLGASLPHGRVAIVADAGHAVPAEQPAAFAATVREFLDTL
ncbi:MAG: alpha/beta fold hydrolase [Candidatus Dormibacteria bacterium]